MPSEIWKLSRFVYPPPPLFLETTNLSGFKMMPSLRKKIKFALFSHKLLKIRKITSGFPFQNLENLNFPILIWMHSDPLSPHSPPPTPNLDGFKIVLFFCFEVIHKANKNICTKYEINLKNITDWLPIQAYLKFLLG
jgi:hypothetical protein